jgi:hypothetical protein
MNPRIEKLAQQAGLDVILDQHAHEYGNGTSANTSYPEVAKFAELIIKECCDVLHDNEMGGYQVNHVLKEHFGVD